MTYSLVSSAETALFTIDGGSFEERYSLLSQALPHDGHHLPYPFTTTQLDISGVQVPVVGLHESAAYSRGMDISEATAQQVARMAAIHITMATRMANRYAVKLQPERAQTLSAVVSSRSPLTAAVYARHAARHRGGTAADTKVATDQAPDYDRVYYIDKPTEDHQSALVRQAYVDSLHEDQLTLLGGEPRFQQRQLLTDMRRIIGDYLRAGS